MLSHCSSVSVSGFGMFQSCTLSSYTARCLTHYFVNYWALSIFSCFYLVPIRFNNSHTWLLSHIRYWSPWQQANTQVSRSTSTSVNINTTLQGVLNSIGTPRCEPVTCAIQFIELNWIITFFWTIELNCTGYKIFNGIELLMLLNWIAILKELQFILYFYFHISKIL